MHKIEYLKSFTNLKYKVKGSSDKIKKELITVLKTEEENYKKVYLNSNLSIYEKEIELKKTYELSKINFKSSIQEKLTDLEISYSMNILKTLFRIYNNKVSFMKKELKFKMYKDKDIKEQHIWKVLLKDKSFNEVSSTEVINIFNKEFNLNTKNNGGAINFINNILKESTTVKLIKLS